MALTCFFPGRVEASPDSSPPAVSRAVVLHLDSEVGDDEASGLTWDEPLRSLDEVQRRIGEGTRVVGLRLAAGWHGGTLETDRPLFVQGGFPPAGLPRTGAAGLRSEPERYRTVLDAMGRGPVLRVRGADLRLQGVSLSGGWSLDGGAVAVEGGSIFARDVQLLDSGPALLGCRDCGKVELHGARLEGGTTTALELIGSGLVQVRLSDFEVGAVRHLLVAESVVRFEAVTGVLDHLEGEALRLPEGSAASLNEVRILSDPEPDSESSARPSPEAARPDGGR